MGTVADKLREARGFIEQGWTRGESYRAGRVCALGAIAKALRGDPEAALYGKDYREVSSIFEQIIGPDALLYEWNDSQPSKKPVLAAFDKAIEFAESEA